MSAPSSATLARIVNSYFTRFESIFDRYPIDLAAYVAGEQEEAE